MLCLSSRQRRSTPAVQSPPCQDRCNPSAGTVDAGAQAAAAALHAAGAEANVNANLHKPQPPSSAPSPPSGSPRSGPLALESSVVTLADAHESRRAPAPPAPSLVGVPPPRPLARIFLLPRPLLTPRRCCFLCTVLALPPVHLSSLDSVPSRLCGISRSMLR